MIKFINKLTLVFVTIISWEAHAAAEAAPDVVSAGAGREAGVPTSPSAKPSFDTVTYLPPRTLSGGSGSSADTAAGDAGAGKDIRRASTASASSKESEEIIRLQTNSRYRQECVNKVASKYKMSFVSDIYDTLPEEQQDLYLRTLSYKFEAAYLLMKYLKERSKPNKLWTRLCAAIICDEKNYKKEDLWQMPLLISYAANILYYVGEIKKATELYNQSVALLKTSKELMIKRDREGHIGKVVYDMQSRGLLSQLKE